MLFPNTQSALYDDQAGGFNIFLNITIFVGSLQHPIAFFKGNGKKTSRLSVMKEI